MYRELVLFYFSDHYRSLSVFNGQDLKNSSQIENASKKERKRYISTYIQTKKYPFSSKTKYPFMNNAECKACYQNLYQCKSDAHLESDDPKFKLSSTEILQSLSVQFTLKLCHVIIDSMSLKSEFFFNIEYQYLSIYIIEIYDFIFLMYLNICSEFWLRWIYSITSRSHICT